MEMQTKRRLIHILQCRIKFKLLSYDLQDKNVNRKEEAKLYVPQLEALASRVSSLAYNYGVYVNSTESCLYDSDQNFMEHYNSIVTSFLSIPVGGSAKNSPYTRNRSEMQNDIEHGVEVKIVRLKGSTIGNFYLDEKPIFSQTVGGLTDYKSAFYIRLVRKMIMNSVDFRLKSPDGSFIENPMNASNDIPRYFFSDFNFVENGTKYDITCPIFNPPINYNGNGSSLTNQNISNYNENSEFEIVE